MIEVARDLQMLLLYVISLDSILIDTNKGDSTFLYTALHNYYEYVLQFPLVRIIRLANKRLVDLLDPVVPAQYTRIH